MLEEFRGKQAPGCTALPLSWAGSVNYWELSGRSVWHEAAVADARGESLAAERPGHPPVCCSIQLHIHHLQDVIVLVKTTTSVELRGYAAVQRRRRRREIAHHSQLCNCWIPPAWLFFFFFSKVGSLQNSFSLQIYFSPQNIKRRWEAHCLAIISQGCSPLSATELCLICLGRCWRGARGRLMFTFSGMWNHKTDSFNTCISPKLQLFFFFPQDVNRKLLSSPSTQQTSPRYANDVISHLYGE